MNIRFVLRQFGLVIMVLCVCMALTMTWSLVQWHNGLISESSPAQALLIAVGVALVLGITLWLIGRSGKDRFFGRREALLLVAMSWMIGAAVAALPFFIWARFDPSHPQGHRFEHFIDCYFESMSGFTTTGATVLNDVSTLPQGLLLWRAATHWLGGLGIVVLFVAVLPMLGVGGKKLFQMEATGPTKGGVHPRIADTARTLWMIYLALTVTQVLLLRMLGGMTWLQSICHTFATLATGGFSTENASIGAFHHRPAVDVITISFMVLAGVNFGLYYQLLRGRIRNVWRDPELRLYLALMLGATLVIAYDIYGSTITLTTGQQVEAGAAESLRQAAFQSVSIQTTTGFCTADFNLWPFLSKAVLILVMFIGGSAGSTGGGIKVIRLLVMLKVLWAEAERVFRPNVVRTIRVGQGVIDPQMRLSVVSYVLGIVLLALGGSMAIKLLEPVDCTYTTALTASVATLNNIGPGLDAVGAVANYGHFSITSKFIMCLLMALGRLEVFAILVLFVPNFWRRE